MSSTAAMPILFRSEPFGGIVFDPADATLVELDYEAFELAQRAFCQGYSPVDQEEAEMVEQLQQLIAWTPDRKTRVVNRTLGLELKDDFHMFSAPTLVDFQITNKCMLGCPHCYADSTPDGAHASWEDIQLVIEQSHECGVCQLALGGGEPLLHPSIVDILALCHEKGIVPNLSTNGMHLDDRTLEALHTYCGAVAVSLEGVGNRFDGWRKIGFGRLNETLKRLEEADIPTVVQVTLSEANFHELDDIVSFCLSKPLYGVIFLAYKPVGRGVQCSRPLATLPADDICTGLREAMLRLHKDMRVGYDCCMTPGIVGANVELDFVDETHLEGCSALRGSVGISAELDVLPCTFLTDQVIGNLKESHLADIWQNATALEFRQRIRVNSEQGVCADCPSKEHCLGGCPAMELINCHRQRYSLVTLDTR